MCPGSCHWLTCCAGESFWGPAERQEDARKPPRRGLGSAGCAPQGKPCPSHWPAQLPSCSPVGDTVNTPGRLVFDTCRPEVAQTCIQGVGHISEVGFQSSEVTGSQLGHPVKCHPVFNIVCVCHICDSSIGCRSQTTPQRSISLTTFVRNVKVNELISNEFRSDLAPRKMPAACS